MTPEDELRLSFYDEISTIKKSHNISIVKRIDTGELFVKKTYDKYPSDVFDVLKENHYLGIPKIHELITDHDTGQTIVIEEYINGKSLETILDQKGSLEENSTISITMSLCDILSPLHRNDPPLIHRDIKPSNIIITENSEVYLVDFDASRLYDKTVERDTELLGTEAYAAPEQYGFLQSDSRTDIYALGVLMREMITGTAEKRHHSCGSLENIIKKCTNIDPENRFQSTVGLRHELAKHLTPEPKQREKSFSYALPGFRGKSIPLKIFSTLMYLLVICVSFGYQDDGMSMADLWVNRFAILTAIILFILLYGNYMDIRHTLPLVKSDNLIVKLLGYAFYTFSIFFSFGLVASLADTFL